MTSSNAPILWAIILYLIYVLIPLFPAILIYKIFPDTKVGTEGFLGHLKINATGAFAAYLIVTVIGFFIIKNINILGLINTSSIENSAWFVRSTVTFWERNGEGYKACHRINDDSIKSKLDLRATPDYNQKNLSVVSFPTYYKNGLSNITYSYPGFESQIKVLNPDSVKFDFGKRTIDLGEVQLKEINQVYDQESIQANPVTQFPDMPTFNDQNQ